MDEVNSYDSNFTKIEDYINKKYDQIALERQQSWIVKELTHESNNNDNNDLNNYSSQKGALIW